MPADIPKRYKERLYSVTITIPADPGPTLPAGRSQEGAFNVVNLPFVATRITSGIVGPSNNLDPNDASPARDGQYLLEFRSDQHNYQSEPILATALHGLAVGGYLDLAAPIELAPKTALTVRITNATPRSDSIKVQVVFHGVEPLIGDPGIPT